MNPALDIVSTALRLIEQTIADARARNDAEAVAALDALVADSAIGRSIVEGAVRAQAAIDAGRELVRETAATPAMGVPIAVDPNL